MITYQSYSNIVVVEMDLVKLLWCRMWHTEDLSESLICRYATHACELCLQKIHIQHIEAASDKLHANGLFFCESGL